MKSLRIISLILFCLGITTVLPAAADTVVDLSLYHVMNVIDDGAEISSSYSLRSQGALSFKSPNTGNVRGDVALSFIDYYNGVSLQPLLSLDRAYLRVRFPDFRLTAGKTRVNWGDGMLFNAADLVFGSSDTNVSLTNQELRTTTKWLTSVNIPLGAFSFFEALIIPPEVPDYAIGDTSAALRLYTTVKDIKVEGGGAFRDDTSPTNPTGKVVSPYVALQGNFGPDWYFATSLNVAYPLEQVSDELKDSWIMSAGVFHLLPVGWQGTLSLRLETLVRPFGQWKPLPSQTNYGIYLYPEVSYAPSDVWNLSLRSIISPIDSSATITIGGAWSVMQGFSLNGYITTALGETTDTFAYQNNASSIMVMLGASWVY